MKDKRDKAYEKIQKELDIPITEIKNKIIGLRSQHSREVAKTNQKKSGQGVSENYKNQLDLLGQTSVFNSSTCFDKICFKMFYAIWPLCKTSACFNLKHV